MTTAQVAPKRPHKVNPNSLRQRLINMEVSEDLAIFVPAYAYTRGSVNGSVGTTVRTCGDGRRYSTEIGIENGVPGTWVWRLA